MHCVPQPKNFARVDWKRPSLEKSGDLFFNRDASITPRITTRAGGNRSQDTSALSAIASLFHKRAQQQRCSAVLTYTMLLLVLEELQREVTE